MFSHVFGSFLMFLQQLIQSPFSCYVITAYSTLCRHPPFYLFCFALHVSRFTLLHPPAAEKQRTQSSGYPKYSNEAGGGWMHAACFCEASTTVDGEEICAILKVQILYFLDYIAS
jgi:hypothetical protein